MIIPMDNAHYKSLPNLKPSKIPLGGSFNFFAATDQAVLRAVSDPKFTIHGLRRADLKPYLSKQSDSWLLRQIKRLRIFGLIKRVPGTYRYYLTKLGRAATAACVHATEFNILPTLATTA
jgi:hypothetical protein